ncbi:MAG: hypothetical protein AMXMBFR13_26610 [Phycisphaerae bacterium]
MPTTAISIQKLTIQTGRRAISPPKVSNIRKVVSPRESPHKHLDRRQDRPGCGPECFAEAKLHIKLKFTGAKDDKPLPAGLAFSYAQLRG